ncbi:uncharacterized protein BDR25DRAFT_309263 [Lindgomyces ingoldianus]|uniref:Uncharacterized protein n=1 Tax=Lindgomyces ingoldianus TaxID=673940 RepID=A0ACB6RCL0_9PLEO|nr:uncharacterized protein BDR25DRAFT_309263 [Lindgomyces ingoldianus]KAF2476926.1 hypothetical protein BDR25DRAFT_309263 [Lindgomyces ingoldianus]
MYGSHIEAGDLIFDLIHQHQHQQHVNAYFCNLSNKCIRFGSIRLASREIQFHGKVKVTYQAAKCMLLSGYLRVLDAFLKDGNFEANGYKGWDRTPPMLVLKDGRYNLARVLLGGGANVDGVPLLTLKAQRCGLPPTTTTTTTTWTMQSFS